METVPIDAVRRTGAGKGPARQCRRDGLVPGVIYGLGQETINLSVARHDLDRALKAAHGANMLIDLTIDGKAALEDTAAIIKKIERQPITREPLCIDMLWVSLKELVTVDVQIHLIGRAVGQELGGIVEHVMHTLSVKCLPMNMPDEVAVDIAPLQIHGVVHVRDIAMPPTVEVLSDPDAVVVMVAAPVKAVEAEAELPEDVAAAEGEE
jgi:large subunit ribosomal protein L25